MIRPHLYVPKKVGPGEIALVRTKLVCPVKPGWQEGDDPNKTGEDRVYSFTAYLDGHEVFGAELGSGIAADPYLAFYVRVEKSSVVQCVWSAGKEETYEISSRIEVM